MSNLTQRLEPVGREPGVKITKLSSTKDLNTDLYEKRGLVRALGCLYLEKCPVSVCFYSKLFSSFLIDVSFHVVKVSWGS